MSVLDVCNSQEVLDVREVIGAFEALETRFTEFSLELTTKRILGELADDDDYQEFKHLETFLERLSGGGNDNEWRGNWYPGTLIRDDHWVTYAQEYAEDTCSIRELADWPHNCINWDMAARELRMDYLCADYDDVTYWFR